MRLSFLPFGDEVVRHPAAGTSLTFSWSQWVWWRRGFFLSVLSVFWHFWQKNATHLLTSRTTVTWPHQLISIKSSRWTRRARGLVQTTTTATLSLKTNTFTIRLYSNRVCSALRGLNPDRNVKKNCLCGAEFAQ